MQIQEEAGEWLSVIHKKVQCEDWPQAIARIQSLLDLDRSVFSRRTTEVNGRQRRALVHVQTEVERILASLPQKPLDFYRLAYGPKAATLLKQAKKNKDGKQLDTLMEDYLCTDAGAEATRRRAEIFFVEQRFRQSARCFRRLLSCKTAAIPSDALIIAAIVFQRNGQAQERDQAIQRLEKKPGNKKVFSWRGKQWTMRMLQEHLKEIKPLEKP